jgi:hypothetical protein
MAALWAWLRIHGSAVCAALALIGCGVLGYSCAEERALHAQEAREVERLTGQVQGLARQADSLSKLERKDSIVYVAEWRTKYLTLHDTVLQHLTDTVTVERFITVADSTVHACQVVLSDCERRATTLEAELAVADSLNRVYRRMAPSWLQRAQGPIAVLTFVVGALLGHALAK